MADADRLLALWMQLTRDGEAADPRYRARPDASGSARDVIVQRWLAPDSLHTVLVADADDTMAGFIAAVPAGSHPFLLMPPTIVITDAVVAPSWRRQGIGRSLVDGLRMEARRAGVEAIEVGTLATDERAVAFWRAMGFDPWRLTLHQRASGARGDG